MPDTIDFDNLPSEIERLHDEAEDLVDLARRCADPVESHALRSSATRKIRLAARLRDQIEEAV